MTPQISVHIDNSPYYSAITIYVVHDNVLYHVGFELADGDYEDKPTIHRITGGTLAPDSKLYPDQWLYQHATQVQVLNDSTVDDLYLQWVRRCGSIDMEVLQNYIGKTLIHKEFNETYHAMRDTTYRIGKLNELKV